MEEVLPDEKPENLTYLLTTPKNVITGTPVTEPFFEKLTLDPFLSLDEAFSSVKPYDIDGKRYDVVISGESPSIGSYLFK